MWLVIVPERNFASEADAIQLSHVHAGVYIANEALFW